MGAFVENRAAMVNVGQRQHKKNNGTVKDDGFEWGFWLTVKIQLWRQISESPIFQGSSDGIAMKSSF